MRSSGAWARHRKFLEDYSLFILSICISVTVWEVLVRALSVPDYILPPPSQIAVRIFSSHRLLLHHSLVTIQEILAGFLLGSALGVSLACAMARSRILERILYPLTIVSQTFPKQALIPLFVVWLGYGMLPKVVISALICFFPVVVNTLRGLRAVDPLALDLMRSLSASRRQVLVMLQIPTSLPYVFSALKIAITLSVVGAIVGEFVGASSGLGHLMIVANSELSTDLLFAGLVVLGVIGLLLFIMVDLLEKHCLSWHMPAEGSDGI